MSGNSPAAESPTHATLDQYSDPNTTRMTPARASESTTFMVEDARSPSAPAQLPIFALLMYCLVALGSKASSHISNDLNHIVALEVLISMLRDTSIADELPDHVVPSRRYRSLLAAAEHTLRAVQPSTTHADAQPAHALPTPSSDDASSNKRGAPQPIY